jgi:hypothetical protein
VTPPLCAMSLWEQVSSKMAHCVISSIVFVLFWIQNFLMLG